MAWAVAVALYGAAHAAEPQVVEASGEAAIVDKNRPLARDRALQDALRNAVSQACGTLVAAATEARNFQLVSDRILTRASGYVSSYEVLSEKAEGGTVKVVVRAKVGTDRLASDLAAIGLTLARKGMPRLAVLIAEQRIDQLRPAAWWGQQGGAKGAAAGAMRLDQRLVENTLVDQWTSAGFTFVDMEALSGKVRAAGILSSELSAEQVREIGNLSDADVVIVGTAVSVKQKDVADLVGDKSGEVQQVSCNGSVSARAFNADNGEILATAEASKSTIHLDVLTCGREALLKAARELAPALQAKLLARWNQQLGGTTRVRVRVSGVDSFGALSDLKAVLASSVRGVQSVDQKSFKQGSAELDVQVEGSAESLATELDDKRIKKRRLKVTGLTANTLELEISK